MGLKQQGAQVDGVINNLKYFLSHLRIDYVELLETTFTEYEKDLVTDFDQSINYPLYELLVLALTDFVDEFEMSIRKNVTIEDVDQFEIQWRDHQQVAHKEEFGNIILAKGYTREIFEMINEKFSEEEKIPLIKLPKHRHTLHGAVICEVDFSKNPIPKDRQLITSVVHDSSRMRREHLEHLHALKWKQDYCPVTYLQAVEGKNIIYLTGEIPLELQKLEKGEQHKALLEWGRTILHVEYNLSPESIPKAVASYTFEIGDTTLARSFTFVTVGNQSRALYIVGDCSLPACYLYGHGILEDHAPILL